MNDKTHLWNLGYNTIKELESDLGILASSKEEIYGCLFGRDSLITSLKLLRVAKRTGNMDFLPLIKKTLINLCALQGKEVNIESGEEPGKCVHEFRPNNHAHLSKAQYYPWYVYPDGKLRNYDSVDATPLFLITFYRYLQVSNDHQFISDSIKNIDDALNWLMIYGDSNRDDFIDYQLHPQRKHGGLIAQNWMDSSSSVFLENTEEDFAYPLAPAEVQAYTFLSYRLWAKYFKEKNPERSEFLETKARHIKNLFNEKFMTFDPDGNPYIAFQIDAQGRQFKSVRSNMGHCLWASLNQELDNELDSIIFSEYIPYIARRLMMPDMFEPHAGIRTLSSYSRGYNPNSYHNGSIWPHDNALIAEGLEIHGFVIEAQQIRNAIIYSIEHFNTPIELFVYDQNKYHDYNSPTGQRACKKQAWSAAAIMESVAIRENRF